MNPVLQAELDSWCIPDPAKRHEKIQRERIRQYKLVRDLQLDKLDTYLMDVLDVGGGPVPVSDLFPCGSKIVVDPLTEEYAEFFWLPYHIPARIEDFHAGYFSLIVCTNALDHVDDPVHALLNMMRLLKPGGYLAILCCQNNADLNPHPAHVHNLTPEFVHECIDTEFETVHQLDWKTSQYRYGHVQFEGKVGQPAFCILARKTTGYSK